MSLVSSVKTDYSQCKKFVAETATVEDLQIQGNLVILGDVEIDGTLNVDDDFSVATTIFTVDAATGNTVVTGTLDVDDATNITSTLSTSGLATLNSVGVTAAATVGTTLGVTGASTLGSLSATTTALVGTTLGVTGASTLGSLSVTTTASVGTTLTATGGITTFNDPVTCTTLTNTVVFGLSVLTGAGAVVIGNAPTDERPSTAWGSTTFEGTQTSRVAAGDFIGAIKAAVAGTYLVWISGVRTDAEDASEWGLYSKANDSAGVGTILQVLAAANAEGQFAMLTIATLVANGIVYPAQTSGVAVSMYAITADRSAQFGCLRLGS